MTSTGYVKKKWLGSKFLFRSDMNHIDYRIKLPDTSYCMHKAFSIDSHFMAVWNSDWFWGFRIWHKNGLDSNNYCLIYIWSVKNGIVASSSGQISLVWLQLKGRQSECSICHAGSKKVVNSIVDKNDIKSLKGL
jgi:hypothetical protein